MKQSQLDQCKQWFAAYTKRYFDDDDYVNAHLRIKQQHTGRTCKEMRFLAEHLGLDENHRRIAELIALFHDVGRFPQFAQYRTYNDLKSVDHGHLGVVQLRREGILDALPSEERGWVETAIEHHGRKSIPSDLEGEALLFLKLIRDADKIDILRVVLNYYQGYREDREGVRLEIELTDEPYYSPEVMAAVARGELIGYHTLRTLNDMKLCQIGWVYDLNFDVSVQRIAQLGFLEQLFSSLPQDKEIQRLHQAVLAYIESRTASGS